MGGEEERREREEEEEEEEEEERVVNRGRLFLVSVRDLAFQPFHLHLAPPSKTKPNHRQSLLSLYRRVLRANRLALPPPLRALGDASAKAEWKAMSEAGNREERNRRPPDSSWHTFALEWSRYADSLSSPTSSSENGEAGSGKRGGGDLSEEQIEAMSPEQRESLAALARAAASASGALLSPPPKGDK